MLQTTVNVLQGFGVPGDQALKSPMRVESLLVNSAGATPNVFGFAATKSTSTDVAKMGGSIGAGVVFAGIMVNPKAGASLGVVGGTVAPTLTIPDNTQADFQTMGDPILFVNTACNIGDLVSYNTTTGALSTYAPTGTPGTGKAQVPNASIYGYPVTNASGGLTVVRLTN
jgi:hypothetical protein